MKLRYIIAAALLLCLISCVSAEKFTPDSGIFAYREVETFDINGINFTVPTDYKLTYRDSTQMKFKNPNDKLKISVTDNATVHKVKNDTSKNITSSKTMFGSQEGYLVDKNGTYTFSYREGGKLVVISSKDMSLMIGAMGKD